MRLLATIGLAGLLAVAAPAHSGAQPPEDLRPVVEAALEEVRRGDLMAALSALEPILGRPDLPVEVIGMAGGLLVAVGRPSEALELLRPLADAEAATPAVLYNAGRAAQQLGDLKASEAYLRGSLAAAPGHNPAARELGFLLSRQGRRVEAYRLLRQWTEREPTDLVARKAAATLALQLRRVPEAAALLEGLPSDAPDVRLLLADLALLRGDPQGALEKAAGLLDEVPPGLARDTRRLLGEAYLLVGDGRETIAILTGHTAGDVTMSHLLGRAQYQSGDPQGALASLEPWIDPFLAAAVPPGAEQDGDRAGRLGLALDYSRALIVSGRAPEAVPILEQVVVLAADDKEAWHLLGQSLAAAGERDEALVALAEFQRLAAAETPDSVRNQRQQRELEDAAAAGLRRVSDLLAAGRTEEALGVVRQEVELARGDPRPRELEIRVLLRLGRLPEARAAAERLVAGAGGSAGSFYSRGTVAMAEGDMKAAEADYLRALEIAPEHPGAQNDLAVLWISQGREAEARSMLQRVLTARPGDLTAQANLDRLETAAYAGEPDR